MHRLFYGVGKYKILFYIDGGVLRGLQATPLRGDRERSDRQRGVRPYGQENLPIDFATKKLSAFGRFS